MPRFINPSTQYTDAAGDPLAAGLLYFFDSGTNDTKATFADINETIANEQPLVLTADGRVPNCFYSGAAKVILTNADDVQFWVRDPVFSEQSTSFGSPWDAITIYGNNDVVTSSGLLYVSLIAANQNNDPASTSTAWTQFDLVKRWNTNETYAVRDPVIYTDFIMYLSLINGNLSNTPDVSPLDWQPVGGATSGGVFADWDLSVDYSVGGNNIAVGSDGNYYVSIQTPNLNNDPISSPTFWTEIDFIKGGNITVIGNVIASTNTNGDINVTPDGTGELKYNGVEVAKVQAPVAGFVSAKDIYFDKTGLSSTALSLTNTSAETFGPTGSGADNIWTELDSLPSSTTALYVVLHLNISMSSTSKGNMQCFARDGDDPAIGTGAQRVGFVQGQGAIGDQFGNDNTAWLPVNSSGIFSAFKTKTSITTELMQMYLKGYAA